MRTAHPAAWRQGHPRASEPFRELHRQILTLLRGAFVAAGEQVIRGTERPEGPIQLTDCRWSAKESLARLST